MPSITEGNLVFTFPNTWSASQYDKWTFYQRQFQAAFGGVKGVDILAVDPQVCSWKIEVKDYRQYPRTKAIDIADEIAAKVRDTLAGILAAAINANDPAERAIAKQAVRCPRIRVVLHLEQPAVHSKLFPRVKNLANVKQRLRQLVRAVDPHPLVVDKANMCGVSWTAV